ncbi:class I SAM-dependent methyltransferase [Sphingomonas lenta]|uniref:class I SAM-dependent methyltransferase n=1 Tax=Sphingomonas lenta TaxID=1141887 RepID=UPI001C3ED856|nr:class I SAM-dependent methyltransferase [Sphingomonas lenta]
MQEGAWLDRLTEGLPQGAAVLDVGCGNGRPIAAELVRRGFRVTGVDVAPALLASAEAALSGAEWIEADMRTLNLGRCFDAVLAWHSFFHLDEEDQRTTLPRLAAHLAPGAPLMWTAGPAAGIAMGEWEGEPLFHASLLREEYASLLAMQGCAVEQVWLGHPIADGPTVYLARRQISPASGLDGSA